jgi:hypothetical protein
VIVGTSFFGQKLRNQEAAGRMGSLISTGNSSSASKENELLELKLAKSALLLQKERSERETKEKISELVLKNKNSEREKSELKAKNENELKMLNASLLKMKEKQLKSTSAELERRTASEKEVKEKNRILQIQLDATKEPTIYDLVQKYSAENNYDYSHDDKFIAPLVDLYDRIMTIGDEQLKIELNVSDRGQSAGYTVLHVAAYNHFPYAALYRLIQFGSDMNAKSKEGESPIVSAVMRRDYATFDNLALLGADLSMKDEDGFNIWQLSEPALFLSNIPAGDKAPCRPFVAMLGSHGIREGKEIPAGFVSPRKGLASPMPELHNKSIVELEYGVERCIRILTLDMEKLREEATEREEEDYRWYGCTESCPIVQKEANSYPLRVIKRLLLAYPAGVNECDNVGELPLILAAKKRNAELVDLLCEMGTCLTGLSGGIFFAINYGYGDSDDDYLDDVDGIYDYDLDDEKRAESIAKKEATLAVFEKHGVTADTDIPVISPLYYESIYYTKRVNDTNWAQYGTILMCMEEIDIKYRKRGEKALSHLSKDAKCFFRAFTCVDGTDGLGNGIARFILTFIGGENTRERLKGVYLHPIKRAELVF